ncbi:hypothetical_protein [Leishmania major strain Friedlin]|nr:hypothetical_protein [Leishmania major strain Friedlin]
MYGQASRGLAFAELDSDHVGHRSHPVSIEGLWKGGRSAHMEMLTADDAIVMPLREGAQVSEACIHRLKGPALGRLTEAAHAVG